MKMKIIVAAVSCLLLLSCATNHPSAGESARSTIDNIFAAQKAGDIETAMALFSDSYHDPQGSKKAQVRQYIGGLIYQNAFANTTMSMDDATTTVVDDLVILSPVRYSGSERPSSFSFSLKREDDDVWRVVSVWLLQ